MHFWKNPSVDSIYAITHPKQWLWSGVDYVGWPGVREGVGAISAWPYELTVGNWEVGRLLKAPKDIRAPIPAGFDDVPLCGKGILQIWLM